jgi:sporulation protein YlmC with PRC-barrel domain
LLDTGEGITRFTGDAIGRTAKEITMKRNVVVAMTAVLYLCSSIASGQPTQQVRPDQPGAASPGSPPSGASGAAGGAASGQSGMSGAGAAGGAAGAPGGATPSAPVAGRSVLGVTVVEMEAVVLGWSARKDLLEKNVYNDAKQKIGSIEDIIITPDNAASFAIIGVGGFLGIGERRVAIPFKQIKLQGGNLVLPGASKEALKALPEFKYAARR